MNKYIDVVLAKAEFTGNFQRSYTPGQIKAMLDEVPAADVVEVIRCEDCKHSIISHGRYCVFGDSSGCLVADDFFCKNGKRRKTK